MHDELRHGGVIMTQHVVVKQSSVADAWSVDDASRQTHKPVARLTILLTCPQSRRAKGRRVRRSQGDTFFSLAAVTGFLVAVAIVFLGVSYLSSVLLETIQSLPHYNQPQAQYSDLGKCQGHR